MINPSELKLDTLPSVALEDRKQLPAEPCIYFAIDSQGTVQYIGQSVNPKRRWIKHHRQDLLNEMSPIRITYLRCDVDLLTPIEEALIEQFNPPLNGHRYSRPKGKAVSLEFRLRWRLNEVMARLRITNQELGDEMGRHEVSISRMRSTDSMPRLDGDALNSLSNALTKISRSRGVPGMVGPSDLFEYSPDDDLNKSDSINQSSVSNPRQGEAGGRNAGGIVSFDFGEAA